MIKIVVVEDDLSIATGLKINLEREGYEIVVVKDGLKAVDAIYSQKPHLVLLDVMLPGMSGFEICDSLRSSGNTVPILFLTARTMTDDRIKGLELGGDDYITKPFEFRELAARIKVILRREEWYKGEVKNAATVTFGPNSVDFEAFKGETKSGEVTLTQKEAMVLKLLVDNQGKVVDRNMILDQVWGEGSYPSNRTIDNIILNLRRYFEEDPKNPVYLLTQYGVGYIFNS